MCLRHADEAARLGFFHAGKDRIDPHAGIDEHRHRAAPHHGIAQGEEIGSRGDEHDDPFGGPQPGRCQAVLVGMDPGREGSEVDGVVLGRPAPAGERRPRHRRDPRRGRGRHQQRRIEPASRGTQVGGPGRIGHQSQRISFFPPPISERRLRPGDGGPQKRPDLGHHPLRGILDDQMRGVGDRHHLRHREAGGDMTEDPGMEAGISHPPDQLHRLPGQERQARFHLHHRGMARMRGLEGDVADEAPDRRPAGARGIGMEIALPHVGRQPVGGPLADQQIEKPARMLREPAADPRRCRHPDHRRKQRGLREHRIEVDEPVDIVGAPDGEPRPDRPPPVVHHERKSADPEVGEELLEMGDPVDRPEVDVGWLVGESAADVVGDDHPEVAPQLGDQAAELESPGGIAVEADDNRPAPLVDVVKAMPRRSAGTISHREEPGAERKKRGQTTGILATRVLAPRVLAVDGGQSVHGWIGPVSYHSNPRNRVLRPLPKAARTTFSPRLIPFSSAPIASAAGRPAETMLP